MNEIVEFLPVTHVTVYPDTGRITRSGNINFTSGENTVILTGLPEYISIDSLRIAILKNDAVRINDIFVEDRFVNVYDENKFTVLKKDLDKAVYEITSVEKNIGILNDEFNIFSGRQNISETFDESDHPVINLKNWEEYLSFAKERMLTNRTEHRTLAFKWMELGSKIKSMESELQKYVSYNVKKEHIARIVTESTVDIESKVELTYMQDGINWRPAYNLRVASIDKKISVTMFGIISQTTGEDWTDVEVMLSTAKPMSSCDIPELRSKRIREAAAEIVITTVDEEPPLMNMKEEMKKPSKKMASRMMKRDEKSKDSKKMSEESEMSYEDSYEPSPSPMQPSVMSLSSGMGGKKPKIEGPADKISGGISGEILSGEYSQLGYYLENKFSPQLGYEPAKGLNDFFMNNLSDPGYSCGGYDYRYKVMKNRNSIPSSDIPVSLTVETREMPVVTNYLSVPLEKELVFLKGTFQNTGTPLPCGPAQVFIDNDFLGNIILPTLGNKQSTFISLGIERDVKILRRDSSKRRTQGIMIGKDIITDFEVEIELQSFKTDEIVIEIYDRIPQWDKKKNIEIFDLKYSVKPDKISARNVLMWKPVFVHGEKKIIKINYTVKQPENSVLQMSVSSTANYEI